MSIKLGMVPGHGVISVIGASKVGPSEPHELAVHAVCLEEKILLG